MVLSRSASCTMRLRCPTPDKVLQAPLYGLLLRSQTANTQSRLWKNVA